MKAFTLLFCFCLFSSYLLRAQTADSTSSIADSSLSVIIGPNYFCPDSAMCYSLNLLKDCSCFKTNAQGLLTTVAGQKVIDTGFKMAIVTKQIVQGSCWQYADTVYKNAGFPQNKRATIFKSSKGGPYADPKKLQPGDWVFHVNYSFHGVEHSAIFVCWKDYNKRIAITLGHVGQNLARSGIYGEYDLRSVYYITRPTE
jgi:hypothetical protein